MFYQENNGLFPAIFKDGLFHPPHCLSRVISIYFPSWQGSDKILSEMAPYVHFRHIRNKKSLISTNVLIFVIKKDNFSVKYLELMP